MRGSFEPSDFAVRPIWVWGGGGGLRELSAAIQSREACGVPGALTKPAWGTMLCLRACRQGSYATLGACMCSDVAQRLGTMLLLCSLKVCSHSAWALAYCRYHADCLCNSQKWCHDTCTHSRSSLISVTLMQILPTLA